MAIVPTFIHNYICLIDDDGKSAANISIKLGAHSFNPVEQNEKRIRKIFDTQDCIERIYTDSNGNKISLFVVRSYDHKRLYHHPEVALSYGEAIDTLQLQMVPASENRTIPVYMLKNKDRSEVIAAYVLLYDGDFVSSPIRQQILNSLNLLVNARKKMTLFYVSRAVLQQNKSVAESNILNILMLAVDSFQMQQSNNNINN